MEAVTTHMNIRWLSEPDAEPVLVKASQKELVRTELPFQQGEGHGWIEMLDLALGMHVCRVVHHFEPGEASLQPMSEVVTELTEPVLFVQTARRGRGVLHDRRLDVRLAHDPGVCIFQHMDRIDHRHWADTSATVEVTALGIRTSKLLRSLGEPIVGSLFEALGLSQPPSASVRVVPKHVTAILQSCFTDHLTGSLRKLHAQAKVLDFIIALAGHLADEAEPESRKIRLIRQLREELDQLNGVVPCLDELAKRYELSERVMNELFKQEYGQSIYAYVTGLRLEAAHAALQSTGTPLKVLAARLGYSSVSHFSNAFTKKFGYRPGSLRRGKSGQ
ncbi:MAG: helix-turn-helix transcriptional regulator [Methylococcus sp.]|nr:helix-turn-helix transcriptional regulator [Methylococcus sp.]